MEILTLKNLTFSYPESAAKAVDDVSFSVRGGEITALCGATGSGKSTLLRLLKREIAPRGRMSGEILYRGVPLSSLDDKTAACRIGFVAQRPEEQTVTDRVYHELAFGLENLRVPSDVIRRRTAEIASFFGIDDWFDAEVNTLSGGQKQLLNLASVMIMDPDILLLDEPTAQLDPIAASDFISTLVKLSRELSLSIIIAEHRLEDVIPVSDKLIALSGGHIAVCGPTRESVKKLADSPELLEGMPAAVRLFASVGNGRGDCPLTVREGRDFIESGFSNAVRGAAPEPYRPKNEKNTALEFDDVCFRYERDGRDILNSLSFKVYENELCCVLGGNGSGKSTFLSVAAGLRKPYSGVVRVFGKKQKEYGSEGLYRGCLALLPQDVQTVFLCDSVRDELKDCHADAGSYGEIFDFTELLDRHPYDLSGGQQQLLALAKVVSSDPRLILLDEPTKGLDAHAKLVFTKVLEKLKDGGASVVIVTHDVEFAAGCADRCALFFRGEIVSAGSPREFFSGNNFYTTAVSRMTRGYYDYAVTIEYARKLCALNGRRDERPASEARGLLGASE